jgi:hypothetical protein
VRPRRTRPAQRWRTLPPECSLHDTLCYAIVLPGRKSAFRAGFWPDCYRENTEIGPPAGRAGRRADFGHCTATRDFRRTSSLTPDQFWGAPESRRQRVFTAGGQRGGSPTQKKSRGTTLCDKHNHLPGPRDELPRSGLGQFGLNDEKPVLDCSGRTSGQFAIDRTLQKPGRGVQKTLRCVAPRERLRGLRLKTGVLSGWGGALPPRPSKKRTKIKRASTNPPNQGNLNGPRWTWSAMEVDVKPPENLALSL